jgi:hypothetical protein
MSDRREQWRSTLPPTSSSVAIGVNPQSDAIRGAALHAFNAGQSTTASTSQATKTHSPGARSAAAAAGGARKAAVPSLSGQNATNTTTASFVAYARGRPPPGVEKQPSNADPLFGSALSPVGRSRAQQGTSPEGSPSQIAARMSSKSRSPARPIPYNEKPSDRPPLPLDQPALLAGKLASLRSYQNASGSSSSHSQTSTPPPVEQPVLNMKQIPFLPKKPPPQAPRDPSAGKLAGAAAAKAAVKHAQAVQATSPRLETSREYYPFVATESQSPDRFTLGGSLEATATKSTWVSPADGEQNSMFENHNTAAHDLQRSTPLSIHSTPRRSPGAVSGSNSAHIMDNRTGMTERTLADAIVASSLASSRAPSPTKIGASVSASRRTRSHSHSSLPHLPHHFLHHEKPPELPTKTSQAAVRSLKHTLRKHSDHKEDEDEETTKRGRKHFMRKHPHKHHEGDRKRWRDKVSERERRRYEGVWAANRGLFVFWEEDPEFGSEGWKRAPEADLVVNVVVRDVWERSRLPQDVLEEIWDLVATSEDAQALQRDQFVVGLWLIDQRLKGRKLPVRVSSDVWNSVRHPGVKISRKPY